MEKWPFRARFRQLFGEAGFSLAELTVVVVIMGILASAAIVSAFAYLPSATVRWGAQEVQSAVLRGKMLAVTTRQSICVQKVAGGVQFRQGTCAGAAWVGSGTDGAGTMRISSSVTLTGANPVFTPFGTASTAGAITVTGAAGKTQTVTVDASGRVRSP
jgi:prepilin-type N-terminal cleavage/methylation domain-containing protein